MSKSSKNSTAARAVYNYIFRPYYRRARAIVPQFLSLSFFLKPLLARAKPNGRLESAIPATPFVFYLLLSGWLFSSVTSSEGSYPKYLLANVARRDSYRGRSTAETTTFTKVFTDGALCEKLEFLQRPQEFITGPDHPLTYYGPGDSTISQTEAPRVEGSTWYTHHRIEVCTGVVSGSTGGTLSSWRRGPGLVLSWIAFTMPPLGAVVAVGLIIASAAFVFALCISFFFILPSALLRGVSVMVRTVRLPRANLWTPKPLSGTRPLVLMLSDTHICQTGIPKEVQVDPALWPATHGRLDTSARLDAVLAAVAKDDRVPVVVAGDITDLGRPQEWRTVRYLLGKHGLDERVILIPGNHDLSINSEDDPDLDGKYREKRLLAYLENARLPDDVICPVSGAEWPKTRVLETAGVPVRLIFLDSNQYYSRWLGSNAIGSLGRKQLQALKSLLSDAREPCLVFLHHHVCDFSGDGRSGLSRAAQNLLMMLSDGSRFANLLQAYAGRTGQPVLVAHGHRHMQAFYQLTDNVKVHAHPSSTMGIEDGQSLDGVMRYTRIGFSGEFLLTTVVVPAPVEITPLLVAEAGAETQSPASTSKRPTSTPS